MNRPILPRWVWMTQAHQHTSGVNSNLALGRRCGPLGPTGRLASPGFVRAHNPGGGSKMENVTILFAGIAASVFIATFVCISVVIFRLMFKGVYFIGPWRVNLTKKAKHANIAREARYLQILYWILVPAFLFLVVLVATGPSR